MRETNVKQIIFSSSATVYGVQDSPEYVETMTTGGQLSNPYGRTKYFIEEILKDTCVADPEFEAALLRYFNPIGAHPSGLLGEDPNGIPNNLMPIVMQVARGKREKLGVYGNDYPTKDGTCRRDYIHVVDLAKGHMAMLDHMKKGVSIYNLGSGEPNSVMEVISAFEKASGKDLPYKGDALLQKTYTLDYLTKTVKKNKGEVKQYYVTNSHEAIIDEDVFNLVQVELQRRSSMRRGLRNNSPFCTKLVCGDCGSFYGHKIFHAKEKHSKDVWYCNRRYQGSNNCSTPILAEGDLIRYYLQALSEILADKDRYISACKAQMDEANALEKIRFKREKAEVALAKDMAKIQALVRENAYISQDQQVYRQRFEEMSEQIEKQKNTIAELQEQELRLVGVREKLYRFIEALESFDAEPTFDSVTWNALVERVLVNPKSLIFEFKNGEKIKITI